MDPKASHAKTSHTKSDLSDTIDNFIKAEQKEVQFVNTYEKISKFKLISSRKRMSLCGWSSYSGSVWLYDLQCGGRTLCFLLARVP